MKSHGHYAASRARAIGVCHRLTSRIHAARCRMQVVLVGMLPICGELLWIDLFIFVNQLFCTIALFHNPASSS